MVAFCLNVCYNPQKREGGRAMGIHESGEMYLETIHTLSLGGKKVRSVDISEQMGYSKPSVSRAVGLLKKGEYIQVDKDGFITLTEKGASVAQKIYERHTVLSRMLIALGVSEAVALEDACRMEHAISDESFEAIKRHIGNI
jgi:Mn-dependent DtxR family transcriptional regulator